MATVIYKASPLERIVNVHFGDVVGFTAQMNFSLAIPIGTTDWTTAPAYLDNSNSSGTGIIVAGGGLLLPSHGHWNAALTVCAQNANGWTDCRARLLLASSSLMETATVSASYQDYPICDTVVFGSTPITAGGLVTAQVSGTSGIAAGMAADPSSHFTVTWFA